MENSALGEGLDDGSTAPHPRHSVNVFQALGLLCTFVVLAGIGGLLAAGLVIPIAAGASTVANGTTKAFDEIPTELEPGELSEASYIYASDGTTLLARTYVENRVVVPLEKISINMQNAVIATEDKRFYSHGGIDPQGMSRALVNNYLGKDRQGGSTLTQQYVKNVLIEQAATAGDDAGVAAAKEPTIERKLKEAKLAIALEKRMTKDEILTNYLNIAQFGATVNGVETAANHYFGVTAADLTVIQAATIAGITAAPNTFDPVTSPEKSQSRRNLVLQRMYEQGFVSKEEYTAARATPLVDTLNVQPLTQGCAGAGGAAYFCDYVTKVLIQDPVFGETLADRKKLLYRGGLRVVTTIDLGKQAIADAEINAAVPADNPSGFAAAMSVVEPGSGKILVMSQDRAYSTAPSPPPGSTSVNYNTDYLHGGSSGFQPGSTFKAFILAEWIREGNRLLDSVSADKRRWTSADFTKTSCVNFRGSDWEPGNADGKGTGQRTVLQATGLSINTAYATMSSKIDLCAAADLAGQIGFRPAVVDQDPEKTYVNGVEMNMGMALGTQTTYPLAMANSYATFASGGVHCEPIAISSVSRDGVELPIPQANCRQVLETSTVNAVNHGLQQVISPNGGAKGNALAGHSAAGKTGTTQSNSNVWFVGYTPALSTAMWMGHPDDQKILLRNVSIAGQNYPIVWGSTIAAPTWKRFMDQALAGSPDRPFAPPGQQQMGTPPAPKPPKPAPGTPPAAPPAPTDGQPTAEGRGQGNGR